MCYTGGGVNLRYWKVDTSPNNSIYTRVLCAYRVFTDTLANDGSHQSAEQNVLIPLNSGNVKGEIY